MRKSLPNKADLEHVEAVTTRFRISPSPYMANLVERVAKRMGRTPPDVLGQLLYRVETLLRHGKADVFGLDWVEDAAILNASGFGIEHADPVVASGGEHIDFDVALLETGGKSSTGFQGVYTMTGSGSARFRALVPDMEEGGTKYLPGRPTAVQAAIDRFQWFERWGIPYGNLGRALEHWQKMHPEWGMEQQLEELLKDAKGGIAIGTRWPYTVEQAQHALDAFRRRKGAKGKPDSIQPFRDALARAEPEYAASAAYQTTQLGASKQSSVDDDNTICAVCNEPIVDPNDVSLHGRDAFAHKGCV